MGANKDKICELRRRRRVERKRNCCKGVITAGRVMISTYRCYYVYINSGLQSDDRMVRDSVDTAEQCTLNAEHCLLGPLLIWVLPVR